MIKSIVTICAGVLVFSAMFLVGMQLDFSNQVLGLYDAFDNNQDQRALISNQN